MAGGARVAGGGDRDAVRGRGRLTPGDPEPGHVCLVDVRFTNDGTGTASFTDSGPTWRVSAYDAQAHEFHGHPLPIGPTAPGATGTGSLVFEVPASARLRRVLLADAMVDL